MDAVETIKHALEITKGGIVEGEDGAASLKAKLSEKHIERCRGKLVNMCVWIIEGIVFSQHPMLKRIGIWNGDDYAGLLR